MLGTSTTVSEPSPDFKGIKTLLITPSAQQAARPNQALISKGLRRGYQS
ncbi:hypothetical protein [Tepidimonas sp.]